MTTVIPAKPKTFAPNLAPEGVEVRFVDFVNDRRKFVVPVRLLLVHTNGASKEGGVDSAWNWAHRAPNQNTCPHYQVDRDGRARKMLPTDRRGIANATVDAYQAGRGDVQEWSLAIETADTGYLADPSISPFTDIQAERIATIIAYEHVVHRFPITTPTEWWGPGVAAHTDPYGYPLWTIHTGKICPGVKKKLQVRNLIMPRARDIVRAWSNSEVPMPAKPTCRIAGLINTVTIDWEPVPTAMHYHVKWTYDGVPGVAGEVAITESEITIPFNGRDLWVNVAASGANGDGPAQQIYVTKP